MIGAMPSRSLTAHDGLDAVAMAAAVRARDVSPVELVQAAFERIEEVDSQVNAFTVLFREQAEAQARAAEKAEPVGPLHGVPVAVKDVLWMRGAPATNGSRLLVDFMPDEDAVVVARLRAAGAVVVGKTNNPEFCYSGFTDNDLFGPSRNPWNLERTPGGSSGGSAAAVAYGAVPLALGTDAGGSVRIPASFCGVGGHKPTFGLVPPGPGWPGFRTLSVTGPIARSARDLVACLAAIAGPDPSDDFSVTPLPADGRPVEGLRVAYSGDLGYAPVDGAVRAAFEAAVERLRAAGLVLEEAHPDTGDPSALWTLIADVECSASEGPIVGSRRDEIRPESRAVIEAGERSSGVEYVAAQIERATFTRRWREFLTEYDLLLTPTMQMTAFPVGVARPAQVGGIPVDPERDDCYAFIFPANLAWLPAVSVPCGLDDAGLPIGLQFTGGPWRDRDVLAAAAAWESLA